MIQLVITKSHIQNATRRDTILGKPLNPYCILVIEQTNAVGSTCENPNQ